LVGFRSHADGVLAYVLDWKVEFYDKVRWEDAGSEWVGGPGATPNNLACQPVFVLVDHVDDLELAED